MPNEILILVINNCIMIIKVNDNYFVKGIIIINVLINESEWYECGCNHASIDLSAYYILQL